MTERHYVKSSRSGGSGGNCVECALAGVEVYVRDSKNRSGSELAFGRAAWDSFLGGIKAGHFDR